MSERYARPIAEERPPAGERPPASISRPAIALISLLWLLLFTAPARASVVETGLWQLESNLTEAQALDLLSNLSFSPASDVSKDAWRVSSKTVQFSDSTGDIASEVVLMPSCLNSSGCTRSSELYRLSGGRIARVGKLMFKPNNLFQIDHSALEDSADQPGEPDVAPNTSAGPPPANVPEAALSFVEQWLSLITLAVVVGLTLLHILRSRY